MPRKDQKRRTPADLEALAEATQGGRLTGSGRFTTCINQIHAGSDYTPEELDFLRAVDAYKLKRRRPHPSCTELLGIARRLGWSPPPPPATSIPALLDALGGG